MSIEDPTNTSWMKYAECAKPENQHLADGFFASDREDRIEAKNLCFTCPVRAQCAIFAANTDTIYGTWGGRDEEEMRRVLSLNEKGKEAKKNRPPMCPVCWAGTKHLRVEIVDRPGGGRWTTAKVVVCSQCEARWQSRSSANAVSSYHADKAMSYARSQRKVAETAGVKLRKAVMNLELLEQVLNMVEESLEPEDKLTTSQIELQRQTLTIARRDVRKAKTEVARWTSKAETAFEESQRATNWAKNSPSEALPSRSDAPQE